MDYKNFIVRFFTSISILGFFLYIVIDENFILMTISSIIIYLFIFFEIFYNFNKNISIMLIYAISSLVSLLIFINYFYNEIFLFFILTIVFFDTFSYIFGSLYGKKKILPKISPNKTIIGFIFGILLTNIFIIFLLFISKLNMSIFLIFYINLIILFSFAGDIIESFFKRKSDIKNSSNLLPGHGGFFDRFDSLVLVSFILPFYNIVK